MFWRAGGFATVYPILDPGFLLSHGAWRSMLIERTPGYVIPIFKYHGVGKEDVLIVCNAYGINAATMMPLRRPNAWGRQSSGSPRPNLPPTSLRITPPATPAVRTSTRSQTYS